MAGVSDAAVRAPGVVDGVDPSHADLLAQLGVLLADVAEQLDGPGRDRIKALERRSQQPLRIAVAGRTNAGKSTLVNALIGAQVAPTRATECTRVLTWYQYGANQARVIRRDGSSVPVYTGPRGELPDELGVPLDEIDRLEVSLSHAPLRRVIMIDTPGLSGDDGLADQTERLLASGEVDVMVFVLGEVVHADEAKIISDFYTKNRLAFDFPNAMGILSRADQYGDGDDPWPIAVATAARHAGDLASGLAGVLPVMGKIAETTETGAFDESQSDSIRALAGIDEAELAMALLWVGAFEAIDCLPPGAARVLLDRLDLFGIRMLTESTDAGTSAAAMYGKLRSASGIAALWRRLEVLYVRPAAVLKATRTLAELDRWLTTAAITKPQRRAVRQRIQQLRDHPAMHALAELRCLAALYSGRCTLPDSHTMQSALNLWEEREPAARLGAQADTSREQLAGLAMEASRWWRAYANTASNALVRQLADTAHWSTYQLGSELRGQS
jgi:hypothetical protein